MRNLKNKEIFLGAGLVLLTLALPLRAEDALPAQAGLAGQGGAAAGASQGKDESSPQDRAKIASYILQPGDRIFLKIYPEDPYIKGGEMQISTEGNITIQLAGKILVSGKSVLEAEKEISKILAEDYLVNPEVVIEVKEIGAKGAKSSVILLGQVRKPGTYDFPPTTGKMTLLEAISQSGGFSDIANIKKIKIVRVEKGKKKVIKANAEKIISGKESDVDLLPGDVVTVAESLF